MPASPALGRGLQTSAEQGDASKLNSDMAGPVQAILPRWPQPRLRGPWLSMRGAIRSAALFTVEGGARRHLAGVGQDIGLRKKIVQAASGLILGARRSHKGHSAASNGASGLPGFFQIGRRSLVDQVARAPSPILGSKAEARRGAVQTPHPGCAPVNSAFSRSREGSLGCPVEHRR